MQLLRNAQAVEATHTSTTAAYAPKCKPGSRAKVIQDIMDWIATNTGQTSPAGAATSILWFQGPAGGGKTCIMREVVGRCEKLGLLTASYFFSTRAAGLNNEALFVATIACQLARTSTIRAEMSQAILENPDILQKSLDFQAVKLFLTPLSTPQENVDNSSFKWKIIIVDGFDECRERTEHGKNSVRIHLLDLLRKMATSSRHFLVVVANRPEVDIRTSFVSPLYRSVAHILRLQDDDGTSEIRDYFCDEFRDIRETHPVRDSIPLNWPTEDILEPLVNKSSGSYIYPSTVIKYIRNPRRNPVVTLREVMSLQVADANPLAELDALYYHILHPPEVDIPTLKGLLHPLSHLSSGRLISLHSRAERTYDHPITLPFPDDLFAYPAGTTSTALCDLHSLVSVPMGDHDGSLQFHHKSLEDYLHSPDRSGDLYQDYEETLRCITQACLFYLRDWPDKARLGSEATAGHRSTALNFAVDYWTAYLSTGT
ncbi:hypothetical protein FA13DRAFT_505578 [Coprinellus micaceus]|uniref:Nephrocystin 3-like N-terminal domain-containing protein n=1 Tax=Coprinellus micaceus TaxID=71717 RepID=A0A4Y7T9W2_COPMI|nr:hypothetical protein FA13DRAFT_505578 [Coprinellus micaceus]